MVDLDEVAVGQLTDEQLRQAVAEVAQLRLYRTPRGQDLANEVERRKRAAFVAANPPVFPDVSAML